MASSTKKSAMSLYAAPDHKRTAKSLGYALTLGTSSAWIGFALVLKARLSPAERAALAFAALISLDAETGHKAAVAALDGYQVKEVA